MKDIIEELRTIHENLVRHAVALNSGCDPCAIVTAVKANCFRLSLAIKAIEEPPCLYGCYQGNLYGKDPEQGPDEVCPNCGEDKLDISARTHYFSMRGSQELDES